MTAGDDIGKGTVSIRVSYSDLLDRISILQIKIGKIGDEKILRSVQMQLVHLEAVRDQVMTVEGTVAELVADLAEWNRELWTLEDNLRILERAGDFGPEFVAMARAIARSNAARSAVKRKIDDHFGSGFREQKIYKDHASPSSVERT